MWRGALVREVLGINFKSRGRGRPRHTSHGATISSGPEPASNLVQGREAGTVVLFKSVSRARVWWVLAATLIPLLMLNVAAQQPSAHKHPAKAAKKTVPEPPPAPAPPPPPPTPEQMPAVPPQVRYSQGQLTIVAENSTLADILRAVRTQTGAAVEVPPNATERVVTHLGPGPARDVLAALLNGSHFNYVMLGSAAHPDSVDRLILTSKAVGGPDTPPPAPVAQTNNEVPLDDPGPQGMDIAEQPVDNPAGDSGSEDNQEQPADGQQQVKTPEQLLRELQQQQLLQQQLQQQQQQQQQPAPPPNENQ